MKEASGNGVFCCPECGATVHLVGYSPVEPDSRSTQPGWPPMSSAGTEPPEAAPPPDTSAQPSDGAVEPVQAAEAAALAASHTEMAVLPGFAPNWSSDDVDEPTRVHRSTELDSAVSSFGEESTVIVEDIDTLLEAPGSARQRGESVASAQGSDAGVPAVAQQAPIGAPLEHRAPERKAFDSKEALVWRLPPPPPPPAPDHRGAARASGHFPAHPTEQHEPNAVPLPSFAETATLEAGRAVPAEPAYTQTSSPHRPSVPGLPASCSHLPEEQATPAYSAAQDFAPTPAYPAALEYAAVPAYPAASAYPAALDYAAVPAPAQTHQPAPITASAPIIEVAPLPPPVQTPVKNSVVGPEFEPVQAGAPVAQSPIALRAPAGLVAATSPATLPNDNAMPAQRVDPALPPPMTPAAYPAGQAVQPPSTVSPTATPAFAAESASRPVTRALSDAPIVRDAQPEPRRGMARAQVGFALGAAVVGIFFLAQNAMRSGDRNTGVALNRETPTAMPVAPAAPAAAAVEPSGDKAATVTAAEAPSGKVASSGGVATTHGTQSKAASNAVQSNASARRSQPTVADTVPAPASPAPAAGQASSKKSKADDSEDSGPGPFDADAAESAVDAAANRASACRQADDPSGVAVVTITFAPSGRVTTATIAGPPFIGTATGSCIAAKMRTAKVPAFSGKFVTVKKTVTIR